MCMFISLLLWNGRLCIRSVRTLSMQCYKDQTFATDLHLFPLCVQLQLAHTICCQARHHVET